MNNDNKYKKPPFYRTDGLPWDGSRGPYGTNYTVNADGVVRGDAAVPGTSTGSVLKAFQPNPKYNGIYNGTGGKRRKSTKRKSTKRKSTKRKGTKRKGTKRKGTRTRRR